MDETWAYYTEWSKPEGKTPIQYTNTYIRGSFLKSSLNLLQYCLRFMIWSFGHKACGILVPPPGMEPAPPALEGEVLIPGTPGKSPKYFFFNKWFLLKKKRLGINWLINLPNKYLTVVLFTSKQINMTTEEVTQLCCVWPPACVLPGIWKILWR